MPKKEIGSRVIVAGEDISDSVGKVELVQVAGGLTAAILHVYVDRLELNHNHAETQTLTVHIAEGLID